MRRFALALLLLPATASAAPMFEPAEAGFWRPLRKTLALDVVRSTAITPGAPALSGTNTFTGSNTFSGVITSSGSNVFTGRTTFGTAAAAANAVELGETAGRVTFEGATANTIQARLGATDPTSGDSVFLLPDRAAAGTSTLAVLDLAQTWSAAQTYSATAVHSDVTVNKSVQGFSVQTLADNVAEDFVEIGCPAGDGSGGTINYYAYAENGTTEAQSETGVIQWNCLNLAGTEVCPAPTEQGTPLHNETTGGTADLTTTWNCTVGLTSVIRVGVAVNNGLASPTLVEIRYRVNVHSGTGITVTALQ